MKILIDCCYKSQDGDGIARYVNQIQRGFGDTNVQFINQHGPAWLKGKLKFLRRIYYLLVINVTIPL